MTSMDYSELFKGNSNNNQQQLTIDDIYNDDDQSNNSTAITTRNIDKILDNGDESVWIINQIEALGFTLSNTELSDQLVKIFSSLFREREHWQLQSQNLSYSCSNLKSKIEALEKIKEHDAARILTLTQDVNAANEKMSALKAEQRDLKSLWLSEKGELESRCFQLQALQTQIQGTLRKKEKDYDRLQAQFTKITKDTQKQVKGQSTTPTMVISQPLQRPSTQSTTKPGTLLEAEIVSAKTTIATLEMENQNLRNAIEDLTLTFQEFQLKMTKELHEKSQSLSELEMRANSSSAALSCLEQAKYIENRLDATTALLTSATNPSSEIQTEANESNPSNLGKFTSPSRIYKPSLIGTPTARPLNWIVKQANTEVKLLRKKAENLQWYIPPAKEVDDETYDENSSDENKENNCANESVTSSSSQFDDLTKRYQTKLHKLKKQLEDAVNVICEQDRLIHAALVGNMSSYTSDKSSLQNPINYSEEDDSAGSDEDLQFEGGDDLMTPMKRNQMNSSYDPSDWSAGFSELLPAVSPDTMAVLKAANFTTLPSHIIDEDGNLEPRTLSSTLEALTEN